MSNGKECPFCQPDEFIRPHYEEFGAGKAPDKTVLFETAGLIVTPDACPVSAKGLHYLVITKGHDGHCLAPMSELRDQMGELLYLMERRVKTQLAFFEHGGPSNNGSNDYSNSNIQTVIHPHGHLIETGNYDITRYMAEVLNAAGIQPTYLGNLDESPIVNLKQLELDRRGYFYVQHGRSGLIALDPRGSFPSQLTQKSMSQLLSRRTIDWKKLPTDEDLGCLSALRVVMAIERCKFR